MVRLSRGIYKGTFVAVVLATATMLACATTPGSDPSESSGGDRAAVTAGSLELASVEVESLDGETRILLGGLNDAVYTVEPAPSGNGLVVEFPGVSQPSASLFDAVSGSDTQVSVYDGLVEVVSASTYEGDAEPVTRVEVSFTVPADYEFVAGRDGLDLVIRPGTATASAEASDIASTTASSDTVEPTASEAVANDDPWAVAEAIDGEGVVAEDSVVVTDQAVVVEETTVVAESSTPAPESSPPATTLTGVTVETVEAGVLVHLQANGILSSAETFTLENPARMVIDLPGIKSTATKDKVTIDSAWVKGVRIGAHPDKLRVVFDGGADVADFQGRRVLPTADGLIMAVGSGPDLDSAIAARIEAGNDALILQTVLRPESTPLTTPPASPSGAEMELADNADAGALAPQAGAAAADENAAWDALVAADTEQPAPALGTTLDAGRSSAEIYGLQYDRDAKRDRIAVLSDRVVEYQLVKPDPETIVVRMQNSLMAAPTGDRITPEPGGPVSLVVSFQQPEVPTSEVRVVIRRAAGLEPQVTQRGSALFLDFENTGLAATPPPATIPGVPSAVAQQEQYANAMKVSEAAASAADPMADAATTLATAGSDPSPLDEAARPGDPGFELPAELIAPLPMEADPGVMTASASAAAPASLEGPAAVDMLAEGGLIDGKEYVGRRISLDFKDVQIADVLRLIAEVSDLNVIAGDEVKGNVTIRLVDVPWDQALDVILLTKGLGFVRVGNVLRIAPNEILKAEEEVRLQERRNKEKLEDLEVKLQPVNYANVVDVEKLVKRLLSPRGTVNTDKRTNTLIIKDISSVIDEATALILAVDTQTPQVMIEAKIVEAALEFGRELGSVWRVATQPWVDGYNPGVPRTDLGNENFRFQGDNSVVVGNPITSIPTGAVNLGAFLLDDQMQIDVHIEAMERAGDGKVISSPRVVTLDNKEASIEQGVSIPFQTFEGGDAKLEFIDAVLSLNVTPHITADRSIIMSLEVTRNAPDSSVPTPTGSPAIAKNQAKTETLVKDGQTLVIGGIYTIDKSTRETRVPYLHRIPVIGAAFKAREISDSRKELLIFITPRIVVNPVLAAS
jgi:type IV pilus assembly protein PilQ